MNVQNEVEAKRVNQEEMSAQRSVHDKQMARAGLEADFMKLAYDKLSCENIEQQRTAAHVSMGCSDGILA